jgi:hypothetical protein
MYLASALVSLESCLELVLSTILSRLWHVRSRIDWRQVKVGSTAHIGVHVQLESTIVRNQDSSPASTGSLTGGSSGRHSENGSHAIQNVGLAQERLDRRCDDRQQHREYTTTSKSQHPAKRPRERSTYTYQPSTNFFCHVWRQEIRNH